MLLHTGLISFICSSNNNIKRIALMLDRLRCRYGQYICTVQHCKNADNTSSDNDSSSGDAWQVSVIDYAEEAAREELTGSSLRSPTPSKAVRKSTASPKTPSDELILPLKYHIFEFPSIEALSQATEAELRALGMGYRAKFISGSAQFLSVQEGGGAQWLSALRDMSANLVATNSVKIKAERVSIKEEKTVKTEVPVKSEINGDSKSASTVAVPAVDSDSDIAKTLSRLRVQNQLMLMPGVGRKVADCVALFSLDQTEGIPVDTHVWDIALRDYDPLLSLKGAKSITPAIYEEVGEVFRKRFPCKAGWAHSVLFAAELPEFRVRLPIALQEEMKAFTEHSKSVKKIGNAAKLDRKKDALRGKDNDDDLDDEVDDEEEDETPLKRSAQKKRKTSEPSPPVVEVKAEVKAKVEAKVKVNTPKKS
jgi:3-methyladenine DNA glycosylase/8-oxoguanine DNA glycosylase